MTKLRSKITGLREAVGPSAEQSADKLMKALHLAFRGKAQVHPADEMGSRGEIEIWLEPANADERLPIKVVERVIALTLGDVPRVSVQITHDEEDGILVTVAPKRA